MIRKRMIIALAATTVFSWMVADSKESNAQLLRRLRQRIQQRAYVPPQGEQRSNRPFGQPNDGQASFGQPGTSPNGQQPGVVPNYNNGSSPNQYTPDGRRRVAPIDPSVTPAPADASKSNDKAPGAATDIRSAGRNSAGQVANRLPVDRQPKAAPTPPPGVRSAGSSGADQTAEQSVLKSANSDVSGTDVRGSNARRSAAAGKPRLGVEVVESRQGVPGLRITGVKPGLGAQSAGLVAGDLIVAVDGQPIRSVSQVSQILSDRQNSSAVQVQVVRNRQVSIVAVPITRTPSQSTPTQAVAKSDSVAPSSGSQTDSPPSDSARPDATPNQSPAEFTTRLGLQVEDVDGQRGVQVSQVATGSPAATAGLEAGDRIVGVNGRLLVDAPALDELLGQIDPKSMVDVRMVRGGKLLSAKIDPNQQASETTAQVARDQAAPAKNSPLQSVGAVLGGLFGGQKSPPNRKSALSEKPEEQDDLALGDDDQVQQVDFESEVPAKKLKMSQASQQPNDASDEVDPLSLDALRLPDDDPELDPAPDAEQAKQKSKNFEPTKQQLQNQIERLKKLIEESQEKK